MAVGPSRPARGRASKLHPGEGGCSPGMRLLKRSAVLVHASWAVAVASALGRPGGRTDRWAGAPVGDLALGEPGHSDEAGVGEEEAASVAAEVGGLHPARDAVLSACPWLISYFAPPGLALLGDLPRPWCVFPAPASPAPTRGRPRSGRCATPTAGGRERVRGRGLPDPGTPPGSVLGPGLPTAAPGLAGVRRGRALSVARRTMRRARRSWRSSPRAAARGKGAGAAVTWAATPPGPAAPAVPCATNEAGRRPADGWLALERWTAWLRPA